jgi:type I restriction enzyme M protein
MPGALLHCPVRGTLTVREKAADGLTFTEEKQRIDCINLLLRKGYPQSHIQVEPTLLRFGNQGRNSFRSDIAVLDQPVSDSGSDFEEILGHIILIAEIKRDNTKSIEAKNTQVFPAIRLLPSVGALGIYWDDVEQRLFYKELREGQLVPCEAPITSLPQWGHDYQYKPLRSNDLETTQLRVLFERIEDRLHSEIASKSVRFRIMLQLLLVKLYDEYVHPVAGKEEMDIQDFTNSPMGDLDVKSRLESILEMALGFYQPYLPETVPTTFQCSGNTLRALTALLAPVRVISTKREVIQDFYMYFASEVYKWDLGQYFTPTEVVDFIVSVVNPRAGERVKDPACGSADFLISAFQHAESQNRANLKDSVWGSDHSSEAVQVSILNMVLNGDGKSQITEEDSLLNVDQDANGFRVILCNPPFGKMIVETRPEVLQKFDLGHVWKHTTGVLNKTDKLLKKQQVGLLFAELCVRQATPGGRVGIILPNGYLGNRSHQFVVFREWLIRHARVAGVVAFPRFTFKKSGADVSASVLFLEKRAQPLPKAVDADTHPFYTGIVESVGWSVGDKRAVRIYKRHSETGAYLTDENNELIPDQDFDRVLQDIQSQRVLSTFQWIGQRSSSILSASSGWSIDFKEVTNRPDLSLDPKRWSQRYAEVRASIADVGHVVLKDVVELIDEDGVPDAPSEVFRYVEIQDVSDGLATPTRRRGWELPSRARHSAEKGDIFVGGIWSSLPKWFVAGGDCSSLIVSNGFKRLRLKPGFDNRLADIIASLVSETYLIQARALCTGSDGLAELSDSDVLDIRIPTIQDPTARAEVQNIADALLEGRATVASVVLRLQSEGRVHPAPSDVRGSNFVQV